MDTKNSHCSAKSFFIQYLHDTGYILPDSRILDMGAGTSNSWADVFAQYPSLHYTAIEPNTAASDEAKKNFGHLPNKFFINNFAYDAIDGFGSFDTCLSLSALEHIKHLDVMLRRSVEAVKSGGSIIHWYDLGHSLHPSSLKERLQVFLGNHTPQVLGQRNFVRYVAYEQVQKTLEESGAVVEKIYNLQSPAIKACLKVHARDDEYERIHQLAMWELQNQDIIQRIDRIYREKLFPGVVVFARKK